MADAREVREGRALVVLEVGRPDEHGILAELVGKPMEHEHATTKPVGADLEPRPVARKRVEPAGPVRAVVRGWRVLIVLAIVENELEVKVAWRLRIGDVAVEDAFQVQVREKGALLESPLLVNRRRDAVAVLRLVHVADNVAPIVVGLFEEPPKHTLVAVWIRGVGDARLRALAVDTRDVVLGRGLPVDVAVGLGHSLDAREGGFDSRPVTLTSRERSRRERHNVAHPGLAVLAQSGNEILGPGQNEGVAIPVVAVLGQAPLGLVAHGGHGERPAEPEGAIPRARVVAQ